MNKFKKLSIKLKYKQNAILLICILFSIYYFVLASLSAMPEGYATLGFHGIMKQTVFNFSPQGWAFFTKDPKETIYSTYIQNPDGTFHEIRSNGFEFSTLFGISRKTRMSSTELGLIAKQVENENWLTCNESINECLAKTPPLIQKIKNRAENIHNFCGNFILVQQLPIPFEWARIPNLKYERKYSRVDIECKK